MAGKMIHDQDDQQVVIQWEDGSLLDQGFGLNPKRVWLDPRLDGTAKALYAFLASYANAGSVGDQVVFPSVLTQRKSLGDNGKMLGKDKYYKMRKQLEDYGYLELRYIRNQDGTIKKVICILKWVIETKKEDETDEPVSGTESHKHPVSANADSGVHHYQGLPLSANADSGERGHITEPSFQQKQSLTEPTDQQEARKELEAARNQVAASEDTLLSVGSSSNIKTKALKTAVAEDIPGMDAVLDEYHRRIGTLNPTKLRAIEDEVRTFGSDPSLLLEAVRITAEKVDSGEIKVGRAVNYISGIMANWRDEGVTSVNDLQDGIASGSNSESVKTDKSRSSEGMPNAGAYQENKDLIRQWKEIYGET